MLAPDDTDKRMEQRIPDAVRLIADGGTPLQQIPEGLGTSAIGSRQRVRGGISHLPFLKLM